MKKGRELSFDLMENMVAAPDAAQPEDESRRRMLRALGKAVQGELTPRQQECIRLLYRIASARMRSPRGSAYSLPPSAST